MFGKRILIAVAHPDDEVVACAAAIGQARTNGATVSALYLTNGCIPQADMWRRHRKNYERLVATRRAEAEEAALRLGIQPVGWATRPARHLWRDLPAVRNEMENAIQQYRPDQLWVPAYEGGNPDHDALNAAGSTFKTRLSVLEFAEYHFFGGKAHSNSFISSDPTVCLLMLNEQERAAKGAALKIYVSERGNLSAIRIRQESCRPIAGYDYTRPPHQGQLWYARHQWVPFHHPRVDYTRPAEVTTAIASFLSR